MVYGWHRNACKSCHWGEMALFLLRSHLHRHVVCSAAHQISHTPSGHMASVLSFAAVPCSPSSLFSHPVTAALQLGDQTMTSTPPSCTKCLDSFTHFPRCAGECSQGLLSSFLLRHLATLHTVRKSKTLMCPFSFTPTILVPYTNLRVFCHQLFQLYFFCLPHTDINLNCHVFAKYLCFLQLVLTEEDDN